MNDYNNEKRLLESSEYWDAAAATFDDEPDHGLRDLIVRTAWTRLLQMQLPSNQSTILDIGCGTGSLSMVSAGLGHKVSGIDLSPAMIKLAQAKAAAQGYQIHFQVMDAAFPKFAPQQFDVVMCRHILWALPEPKQVLQRWAEFLKPKGRLILIEGYWWTGSGLHAKDITAMLPSVFTNISVRDLSKDTDLWGGSVTDERYVISADLQQ